MSSRKGLGLAAGIALATLTFARKCYSQTAPRAYSDSEVAPINAAPNPYQRIEGWAELPRGMSWPAVAGVQQGPDGNLYVLERCHENSCEDRTEPAVLVLSMTGKLVKAWGSGLFNFPHGFFVDQEGNVWITDARAAGGKGDQVLKFTPDGNLLMTLGTAGVAGKGPDLFDEPAAVVVAPNGDIFVADGHRPTKNNRIVKFSKDGKFITSWGMTGTAPGEIREPHTIAMDSRGRLFVGDRENNRIQIFDQDGKLLDIWRQFGRPSGIFITKDDKIYVADSESWGADQPGWKKGIRVGSAKDGKVTAFIEDIESTTQEHSGAEQVGVDDQGNIYGAVVRRKMLEKFVKK
jgi:hypothetical protein